MALRRIADLGGKPKIFGTRATAAPSSAVGQAKARARRQWQLCRSDRYLAPIADRAWSETLQHIAGADAERAEIMLTRTQLLFEILLDRRRWPTVVHGMRRL
jgi:hypothetical protein